MSNVIVGVTGGIAAYKTCELVRLLKKAGHNVKVVMTACSKYFVGDVTFSALSGETVYGDEFFNEHSPMLHIELAKWADKVIIAPTTAVTLSTLASGNASSLLSALCLATKAACYLVPAMNEVMWHHPAVQDNIAKLTEYGYCILPPESGSQACGDIGFGRLPEPENIYDAIFKESRTLANLNVLITAGPTYEKLDPIRYIGNLSSGKMGYAIAKAFNSMGANVHIISGPTHIAPPLHCQLTRVVSAQEMLEAVESSIDNADIFICAAAIANYTTTSNTAKIKSTDDELTLRLTRTPDILQTISLANQDIFSIGFCAETENIIDAAKVKLIKKGCHAIVANHINKNGEPFGSEDNQAFYVTHSNVLPFEKMSKQDLASRLVERFVSDFCEFRNRICQE